MAATSCSDDHPRQGSITGLLATFLLQNARSMMEAVAGVESPSGRLRPQMLSEGTVAERNRIRDHPHPNVRVKPSPTMESQPA